MFRLYATITVLTVLGSALAAQGFPLGPKDSLVPGTYAIRICRAPCNPRDSSRLLVKGTIVLLPRPVPPDSLPVPTNADYFHAYHNACFNVKALTDDEDTFAGIFPIGMVGWDRDPDDSLVQFSLYWSPDARYWVKVTATGGHLYGHGKSDGPFFGSRHPIDSVYGERIGPPDERRCIAAAKWRPR